MFDTVSRQFSFEFKEYVCCYYSLLVEIFFSRCRRLFPLAALTRSKGGLVLEEKGLLRIKDRRDGDQARSGISWNFVYWIDRREIEGVTTAVSELRTTMCMLQVH